MLRESIESHKTGWVRTAIGMGAPVISAVATKELDWEKAVRLLCLVISGLVGLAVLISHVLTIRWKLRERMESDAGDSESRNRERWRRRRRY